MELDHVLVATDDLDGARRELEERFGLGSLPGGQHPSWGTANAIVPLGDAYLELITVVDDAQARASDIGKVVRDAATGLLRPFTWVLRVDDVDSVAAERALSVVPGSRVAPTGQVLSWRLAGVSEAAAEPGLPFFIEWGEGTPFPGSTPVAHPAGDVAIAALHLTGDAGRLSAWLGGEVLPIVVSPGAPAVEAVVLATSQGEVVIGR